MQLLEAIKKATGLHTLIDHQAFPLLLASAATTVLFGLYPGVNGLLMAYGYQPNLASVTTAVQQSSVSVSEDEILVPNIDALEASVIMMESSEDDGAQTEEAQ